MTKLKLEALTGEEIQEAGRIGAYRAKTWLEATTRAHAHWYNPVGAKKLKFPWAKKGSFSFDLGGVLRGEELDGKEFLAECKYYRKAYDQAVLYREYLAKCYRAYRLMPHRCDIFMWITWSPFLITRWDEIRTPDFISECVQTYNAKALDSDNDEEENVDIDVCKEISDRLWLIFLSAEQEKLIPTVSAREAVEAQIVRSGGR